MGLPIQVQHTEAERNKLHAGDTYVFSIVHDECNSPFRLRLNLPPGVSSRHGGMQSVKCLASCAPMLIPYHLGSMSGRFILILRNPISNRSSNPLAS